MAIKYLHDDQRMTLDDVLLAVENCLAQLNLAGDSLEYAKDDDGTPCDGAVVLDNATGLLEAIQGAVSDLCDGWPTVKIMPSLYQRLLHMCGERAEEMSRDFSVEDRGELAASVVNSVLAKVMEKPVDVRAAFKHRIELVQQDKRDFVLSVATDIANEFVQHAATGRARKALLKAAADAAHQIMKLHPGLLPHECRTRLRSLIEEKIGPTAGQSGQAPKAQRARVSRKNTAKARRRQSRAA